MIKDAVIQSIASNGSDVKQVNTIHLYNIDWEFSTRIIMLLLNAVISNSANNKVFTAELIDKSIAKVKDIIDSENKLYNNDIYNDGFTLMDVYAPNPLIDVIDENDAYISIDWCIENGKINLSKTMVKGIESLFERKYISDINDYKTVTNEIISQMPITDTISHTKELSIDKTDIAINNTDIQSLRSVYDKYLTTHRTDTFHNWLYSPGSKVIINITACDVLKQNNLMMRKLTDEQLEWLINTCTTTAVATNPKTNDKVMFYMIKIAGHAISMVMQLEDLLIAPTSYWLPNAKYHFTKEFYDWLQFDYKWDKERYIKLCEDLDLPNGVKDSCSEFDITYLTEHEFEECNEDDMAQIFGEMWKPLSDDEIRALCKIKI